MLDTIQKKCDAEKKNIENNAQITINNTEQKYQKQIKDIQDNHNRLYTQLINDKKRIGKRNKSFENRK